MSSIESAAKVQQYSSALCWPPVVVLWYHRLTSMQYPPLFAVASALFQAVLCRGGGSPGQTETDSIQW